MTVIERQDLLHLLDHTESHCVSAYMPAHRKGADIRQDPIRYKNVLRTASDRLAQAGLTEGEARRRMEPLEHVIFDGDFWRHQGDGLAMFVGEDLVEIRRLPIPVEELVVVSDRFHLTPVLPLVIGATRFHLLALSQRRVQLFEATPEGIQEMPLRDVPHSLDELTRYVDAETQIQWHTGTAMTSTVGGPAQRPAMFHGQGTSGDETMEKRRLHEFCTAIERGVSTLLENDRSPLLLAATEPIIGIYREVNSHPTLQEQVLRGNPDRSDVRDLHREAVELLRDEFDRPRQESLERYVRYAGSDLASDNVEHVITAAHDGRVHTLFVGLADHIWGRYDLNARQVEYIHGSQHAGDEDLLDHAACMAFRTGAMIHVVDRESIPDQKPLAAVFRFAM